MSAAASQAWAFYRQVAASGRLWTIRDSGGFFTALNSQGKCAQPFWSSLKRAQRIIATVPAYAGFEPVELTWAEFRGKLVDDLNRGGFLVGVNWSGAGATGYDLEPDRLVRSVEALRSP